MNTFGKVCYDITTWLSATMKLLPVPNAECQTCVMNISGWVLNTQLRNSRSLLLPNRVIAGYTTRGNIIHHRFIGVHVDCERGFRNEVFNRNCKHSSRCCFWLLVMHEARYNIQVLFTSYHMALRRNQRHIISAILVQVPWLDKFSMITLVNWSCSIQLPTSCANKWGQYTPTLITSRLFQKYFSAIYFATTTIHKIHARNMKMNRAQETCPIKVKCQIWK